MKTADSHEARTRKESSAGRQNVSKHVASRDFDELITVRIYRIAEVIGRLATQDIQKRYDIRLTDMRILGLLHNHETASIAEISRWARIDKAWISRLARELEQKKLVTRRPDPKDSRSMLVSLTQRGRDLQEAVFPQSRKREAFAMRGIERRNFIRLLDAFEQNLDELLQRGGQLPE